MKNENHLRMAIGVIILDKNDNLIAFQRKDFQNNWQGPEGGIDNGESSLEALYRELYEEINLKKNDFIILKETKNFIPYFFSDNYTYENKKGQKKKFYLIKLKNSVEFKFDNTAQVEFISSKIVSADELVELVPDFKQDLYFKVLREFKMI